MEFLNSHEGVEAYVEPKTVVSPKSVVLIDGAGEWRRFELIDLVSATDLGRTRCADLRGGADRLPAADAPAGPCELGGPQLEPGNAMGTSSDPQ